MTDATALTDQFDRALLYATHVHGGQVRKQTSIPYVAHLLAVAATVIEYGGSEDMAIAGLLHDAVEDQGGETRLGDIRNRFGDRVADIVRSCSDSVVEFLSRPTKRGLPHTQDPIHRAPEHSRPGNASGFLVRQNTQRPVDPSRPSKA